MLKVSFIPTFFILSAYDSGHQYSTGFLLKVSKSIKCCQSFVLKVSYQSCQKLVISECKRRFANDSRKMYSFCL